MTWDILVKILHIVGTVLGVGGATFAEIFNLRAIRDPKGAVDQGQSAFLRLTYTVLRVGMILLLVSGFGYLLLLRFEGGMQYIYSPRTWAKLTIVAIILVNALLLQTKMIPIKWGSAISLTSWYAALIIGAWRGLPAGYWGILGGYVVAIFVVAWGQSLIRKSLEAKA